MIGPLNSGSLLTALRTFEPNRNALNQSLERLATGQRKALARALLLLAELAEFQREHSRANALAVDALAAASAAGDRATRLRAALHLAVITSYSIHYTKLYESRTAVASLMDQAPFRLRHRLP